MTLYALVQAGYVDHPKVKEAIFYLSNFLQTYGMPDFTWDLSWVVMLYAHLPDEKQQELALKGYGKLLDSVNDASREDDVDGIWGPVSFHDPSLLAIFARELELRAQMDEVEAEKTRTTSKTKLKRLNKELTDLNKSLNEILAKEWLITQHGKRLTDSTNIMKADDDYHLPVCLIILTIVWFPT